MVTCRVVGTGGTGGLAGTGGAACAGGGGGVGAWTGEGGGAGFSATAAGAVLGFCCFFDGASELEQRGELFDSDRQPSTRLGRLAHSQPERKSQVEWLKHFLAEPFCFDCPSALNTRPISKPRPSKDIWFTFWQMNCTPGCQRLEN